MNGYQIASRTLAVGVLGLVVGAVYAFTRAEQLERKNPNSLANLDSLLLGTGFVVAAVLVGVVALALAAAGNRISRLERSE